MKPDQRHFEFSLSQKRMIVTTYDTLCAFISFPLALYLRLGTTEYNLGAPFWPLALGLFLIKICFFQYYQLNRGIWRFSSIPDLKLILKSANASISISYIGLFLFILHADSGFPRSVVFLDWFIIVFLLGFGRFGIRLAKESLAQTKSGKQNSLIIGNEEAMEQILREMLKDSNSPFYVAGLVSEVKGKRGRTIYGKSILGSTEELENIIDDFEISHAFLALTHQGLKETKELINFCLKKKVKIKVLPPLKDIASGKFNLSQLREVNIDDLLGRVPAELDMINIKELISGKTVLITGAGGSIGREISMQVADLAPKALLILDNCEFFLYKIEKDIQIINQNLKLHTFIADIRDKDRLQEIFENESIDLVIHAAAYKHVPMMEKNSFEAFKTNVMGSIQLAKLSKAFKVPKFILISTDKAVNPTSVMGSTKRVAELATQFIFNQTQTSLTIVRFGNVLGSAGSAIPLFMDQIKEGGPLTVTHPEMTRYFMSIPEAARLVLQASTQGKGGEIFVLDMGEPIKIKDLAVNLIRLTGLEPEKDIEIIYTGLRPGEKLYEELLANSENTLATTHEKVRVAKTRSLETKQIKILETLVSHDKSFLEFKSQFMELIKILVPEYSSKESKNKASTPKSIENENTP